MTMTTIAFLVLGNMGGPMAANLVAAGQQVRGFDPVATLKAATADKGATVFDSGAEAVTEADVVNAAGYLPGISPGTIAYIRAAGIASSLRGSAVPPRRRRSVAGSSREPHRLT